MTSAKRTLILGVGNLLMGDEGVGIHAVRLLEGADLPSHVELVDGGTGGFHLLSYFQEYDPLILIDATMDEKPPGTVSIIMPKFASDFPRSLSAHDIGLKDLVESAALSGTLPTIHLITVSIKEIQPMRMKLSDEVQASLPSVTMQVMEILGARMSQDIAENI